MDIIACAGRREFTEIAHASGFKIGLGLQTKGAVWTDIFFMDQDWKKPNRSLYMEWVRRHKPVMATVLDLERPEQFDEVMDWTEEIAPLVGRDVIIIPKCEGVIDFLPRSIAGKRVVLGYSVPSRYGATHLPFDRFTGWPIHLLGGSPHKQLTCWQELRSISEVVSIDGNYHSKMATRFCQFFSADRVPHAANKYWPTLKEWDGQKWNGNGPVEAYRRSCHAIINFWRMNDGLRGVVGGCPEGGIDPG